MFHKSHKLHQELYLIVVIKILAIVILWWAFIQDTHVEVDGERIAAHLMSPPPTTSPLNPPGETHAQ